MPVKRELTAEDYVYALKRHYDPRWKSGNFYIFENAQILRLSELRKKVVAAKQPFDHDAPVEGLRTLDRYTLQIRLGVPTPRFMYYFSDGSPTGAVAREFVLLANVFALFDDVFALLANVDQRLRCDYRQFASAGL